MSRLSIMSRPVSSTTTRRPRRGKEAKRRDRSVRHLSHLPSDDFCAAEAAGPSASRRCAQGFRRRGSCFATALSNSACNSLTPARRLAASRRLLPLFGKVGSQRSLSSRVVCSCPTRTSPARGNRTFARLLTERSGTSPRKHRGHATFGSNWPSTTADEATRRLPWPNFSTPTARSRTTDTPDGRAARHHM